MANRKSGTKGVHTFVRTAVVLVLAATSVAAQVPARAPATPDSVLAERATPSPWRTVAGEYPLPATIVVVEAGAFEVLLLAPGTAARLGNDPLFAEMIPSCRRDLRISTEDSVTLATYRPWVPFDEAAAAQALITMVVTPLQGDRSSCEQAPGDARRAASVRGLQFSYDTSYNGGNDVRAVELVSGGRVMVPRLAGRATMAKAGKGGAFDADGTEQVRLYFDFDAFAVTDSALPRLEVRIWNEIGQTPHVVAIPQEALEKIWWGALVSRAATMVAAGPERDAVVAAAERIRVGRQSTRERRADVARVATALGQAGDVGAARTAMRSQIVLEPCLAVDAPASSPIRALADQVRPAARCTSVKLPVVLAKSLVPGWGQVTEARRRNLGIASLVLVGGAMAYGMKLQSDADQHHARYEMMQLDLNPMVTDPFKEINSEYVRAEDSRTTGNLMFTAGVAIWAAAAAEALFNEYRHTKRVAEESAFDGEVRRLSLRVMPRGNAVGLSLSWTVGWDH